MNTLYTPELATIKKIETLTETEKLFEIEFKNGKQLGHKPGQFVEVSVFGYGEAPISVSSSPSRSKNFELGIRKVGNVTNHIHTMKVGDTIGIRGPFGTSFPYEAAKGKDILIVAGGIGLVPVRSFIQYILDHRKDYGRLIIFFGARTSKDQLFVKELAEWKNDKSIEYFETVDRGDDTWKGNVGVITTLFPKVSLDPNKTVCNIVGPPVMFKFCLQEAKKANIPDSQIYMSLERRMKCGVGKCGHCQINGKYCCQDGPVFVYTDIHELKEAL